MQHLQEIHVKRDPHYNEKIVKLQISGMKRVELQTRIIYIYGNEREYVYNSDIWEVIQLESYCYDAQ